LRDLLREQIETQLGECYCRAIYNVHAVTPRRENHTIICIAFYVARVACRAPDRRPSLIHNVVTHRLLEHTYLLHLNQS